jgi:hypothetical protein
VPFTNDPKQDYARASTWLDSIRALGANCRAVVVAGLEDYAVVCRRFLDQLRPGAEYEQIGWRLKVLESNDQARLAGLRLQRGIRASMDEIQLHREFVQSTMARR